VDVKNRLQDADAKSLVMLTVTNTVIAIQILVDAVKVTSGDMITKIVDITKLDTVGISINKNLQVAKRVDKLSTLFVA